MIFGTTMELQDSMWINIAIADALLHFPEHPEKRKKANKSHILTKMKTKRKRQLRGTTEIAKGDQQLVDKMLKTKT